MSVGGGGQQGPFVQHEYMRFTDVKQQCGSVLASAAELKFNAHRTIGDPAYAVCLRHTVKQQRRTAKESMIYG
jgi:hypothetical protein